jgi:hypothetical protein
MNMQEEDRIFWIIIVALAIALKLIFYVGKRVKIQGKAIASSTASEPWNRFREPLPPPDDPLYQLDWACVEVYANKPRWSNGYGEDRDLPPIPEQMPAIPTDHELVMILCPIDSTHEKLAVVVSTPKAYQIGLKKFDSGSYLTAGLFVIAQEDVDACNC